MDPFGDDDFPSSRKQLKPVEYKHVLSFYANPPLLQNRSQHFGISGNSGSTNRPANKSMHAEDDDDFVQSSSSATKRRLEGSSAFDNASPHKRWELFLSF